MWTKFVLLALIQHAFVGIFVLLGTLDRPLLYFARRFSTTCNVMHDFGLFSLVFKSVFMFWRLHEYNIPTIVFYLFTSIGIDLIDSHIFSASRSICVLHMSYSTQIVQIYYATHGLLIPIINQTEFISPLPFLAHETTAYSLSTRSLTHSHILPTLSRSVFSLASPRAVAPCCCWLARSVSVEKQLANWLIFAWISCGIKCNAGGDERFEHGMKRSKHTRARARVTRINIGRGRFFVVFFFTSSLSAFFHSLGLCLTGVCDRLMLWFSAIGSDLEHLSIVKEIKMRNYSESERQRGN